MRILRGLFRSMVRRVSRSAVLDCLVSGNEVGRMTIILLDGSPLRVVDGMAMGA